MLKLRILFVALLSLPVSLQAYTICAGETYTGTMVVVLINTVGSMGVPQDGLVTITPKNESARNYTLSKSDIVQFFEAGDVKTAFIGLAAYQAAENPVWIKYHGKNYDVDPVQELRDPKHIKQSGNEMRVWKGPGYSGSEQFQFTDVVCTVGMDA
jgi:hypothetical protein